MAKLQKLFDSGAQLSHHDVAEKLYISPRNAREYLKEIRADIRVVEWRRVGSRGLLTPIYGAKGNKDDAQRPVTISSTERQRRNRLNEDFREREAKKRRIKRLGEKFVKNGLPKPKDALTAALVTPLSMDHE